MHFAINRNRLTHSLDLANATGLEIGPLVNPIITRAMGNVKYVDRASTEDLRTWYSRDDKINVDDIVDIDYIWGEQSLSEATGDTAQFDYCIASHVIEHIPDLITWLGEIASILKPGGVACFAVPDKRYTFDCLRPLTTTADLVDSYLNKLRKPSFRHIYDHFSNFAELDIQTAWAHDFDAGNLKPANSPNHAYNACIDSIKENSYVDSHCSVFTEGSFFELLESVSALGLLDFRVNKRFEVKPGMFEFVVQLEKLDSALSPEQKHAEFTQSLEVTSSTALLMDFTSDQICDPKVYYDIGNGINEIDSQVSNYTEVGQPMQLRFKLPPVDILKFRFDPSDNECSFQISGIRWQNIEGYSPLSVDTLEPLNQIAKASAINGRFSCESVKGANDPSILIPV